MATSVMGVMKMVNIVPRAGVEHTSLEFRACVPPFIAKCRLPDLTRPGIEMLKII